MLYKAHCIYVMSGVCSFEHYPNINEFYLALSFSFFLSSICTHSFMTNMRFIMVSSHTTLHFSPASFCLQVIIFALANVKISLIPTLLFFRFVHFFCLEKQSCYSPFPVPNADGKGHKKIVWSRTKRSADKNNSDISSHMDDENLMTS